MKNHALFFEAYAKIENEKERLGFLMGYLFALSPKEMTRFLTHNFEIGFLAYEQMLAEGTPAEITATKAELFRQLEFLEKHPVAAA